MTENIANCPPAAVAAILEFEGLDQPSKWAGEQSGITIGVGYDLGYTAREEFAKDWRAHLGEDEIVRLGIVCGLHGIHARAIALRFRDIKISKSAAMEVFTNATLPRWRVATARAFPGIHALPPMAQGMLVSLTFNRGPGMTGPRRAEMRFIRVVLQTLTAGKVTVAQAVRDIAAQIEAMCRLWPHTPGLQTRRRKEAAIVRNSLI